MKKYLAIALFLLLALPAFSEVSVQAVKGIVGVMAGAKLQPVSAGMKLKDDATVVTGANSEVTLTVNNGTITLKSLTTAKLRGVAVTKASSTADVALRNGTVVSDVKQITGLKTSFTVTTPVGTSSVRGTTHSVSYSPGRGMSVAVSAGVVAVASTRGATRPVSAGLSFTEGAGAAPPQVAPQAADAPTGAAAAAAAFAPPEEVAAAAGLGGEGAAAGGLAGLVPNNPTTGTVRLTVLFE